MGVGRRTTLFFKLQLQEDINFFACFLSPDILYSSSPESGDPDPRPDPRPPSPTPPPLPSPPYHLHLPISPFS